MRRRGVQRGSWPLTFGLAVLLLFLTACSGHRQKSHRFSGTVDAAVAALNRRILANAQDDGLPFLLVKAPRRCALTRTNPLYSGWVSVTVGGIDGRWLQANVNPKTLKAATSGNAQIIFGRGRNWRTDMPKFFAQGLVCEVTQAGTIRVRS